MADENEPAAPAPAAAPAAKSSMPLLLVCVLNLGATGFVAFKVMHAPKSAAETAAAEKAEPAEEKLAPPGPTAQLDPFVINLNEPGSNRYLKATFELELTNDKVIERLTRDKRIVRDEMLRYLSGLAVADTMGETGKAKIQEQVVARVDKILGGGKVKRVYFTDFVVQ